MLNIKILGLFLSLRFKIRNSRTKRRIYAYGLERLVLIVLLIERQTKNPNNVKVEVLNKMFISYQLLTVRSMKCFNN